MARRIDAEARAAMVEMYLSDDSIQFKQIAEKFGVLAAYVSRIIHEELKAGNGIKPDRRAKEPENPWMAYITPLHKRKMELEQKVEHRQAELEKAKQELRDFTATIRQLMDGTT
jgi:transposase-like protein